MTDLRTRIWWKLETVFWKVLDQFSPRCPQCHQRLGGPIRMTPYGRCVECEERLWDLNEKWS